MSNGRFLVFADTLLSATDLSKNVRSEKPLLVVENITKGLPLEKQKELRERFGLKANQFIRLDHIWGLEHFLLDEGKALCGTNSKKRSRWKPSPFQEFKGFVNCPNCLKERKK